MRFVGEVVIVVLLLLAWAQLPRLSHLGARIFWAATHWIFEIGGIQRVLDDFAEKTADSVDGPHDPMEEIGRIREASVMSAEEEKQFYEHFEALARDVTWDFANQMSDDPRSLTPILRRLVCRLYHFDRQSRHPQHSFLKSEFMHLAANQRNFIQRTGGQNEDALTRVRLQLVKKAIHEHPLPAFMGIFQNNLINLTLAYRSEPPSEPMYQVLDALVSRLRSLDHDGFVRYERTYCSQQPWQLTRRIVDTISAPSEQNRAGRAAVANAMATVFRSEEVPDFYSMTAQSASGTTTETAVAAKAATESRLAPKRGGTTPSLESILRSYASTPNNKFIAVIALRAARRLSLVDRHKAENLLTILDPVWRRQNPDEFLNEKFHCLGAVAPADLVEAYDLGTEDLDRMILNNPHMLGTRQIFLPIALMPSKLDAWWVIRRLLALTKGRIRLYSNNAFFDEWVAAMDKHRRDRLKRDSRRIEMVPSKELERILEQTNIGDLVISSAEPREWRSIACIRANRLCLIHGELLDSAIAWAVTQLVPSMTMHPDHATFLDSVRVTRRKIRRWAEVKAAVFPFDPASILFVPADVEPTEV
jgi:hypothetical protein